MPELPELEAIKAYLSNKVRRRVVDKVETFEHTVIRFPNQTEFVELLKGSTLVEISRFGKIIRFHFKRENKKLFLDLDHGLTGRLDWLTGSKRKSRRIIFILYFSDELNLVYHDKRLHGSVWLFSQDNAENIAHSSLIRKLGPDIMNVSKETFLKRIKKFRGEIKRTIINQKFVSGIGNAYADEILYEARINPFTKATSLSMDDLTLLYEKSREVLNKATEYILNNLNENNQLDNESNWRKSLFKVHLKNGELCPRCQTPISIIDPRRPTNFCRVCQPSENRYFI
ncbi:MAG: DNA-formamidopyrimidine glycosylase family protein [Candidatus Hodarchaeales archaeon]